MREENAGGGAEGVEDALAGVLCGLYEDVSAYRQREVLVALPNARRKLITLIMRKLLASSSAAIGAPAG